MNRSKEKEALKGRMTHIMADGHIEENLTEHYVVYTPETEEAFRVMSQVARRIALEENFTNAN